MNLDDVGIGAGGGILSAVLIALGLKSRIDGCQTKETCNALHEGVNRQFDLIRGDVGRVESKVDEIIWYLKNGTLRK